MAINQVKVTLNGTQHTLDYNSTSGKWEKTISAPTTTSYNLDGGYYPLSVSATNTAGTTATLDATEEPNLRLVVKEKIKPTIAIVSPSDGAYVANSSPTIKFTISDESGGSGVNPNSIVLKVDGNTVAVPTKTKSGNTYTCQASCNLSDGAHTIIIDASDNDGNTALSLSSTFTVDTVPPELNISSPQNGYITNDGTIVIVGSTNDITSTPVVVKVKVNGTDTGTVAVEDDGTFSKEVTIVEGSNTLVITATDRAGKVTEITLNVTLDTSVPEITNITITPNPVDSGATMTISVEVS